MTRREWFTDYIKQHPTKAHLAEGFIKDMESRYGTGMRHFLNGEVTEDDKDTLSSMGAVMSALSPEEVTTMRDALRAKTKSMIDEVNRRN